MPSPLPPVLRIVRLEQTTSSQLVGWMDHIKRYSVEKPSKRTPLQRDGLDQRRMPQRILRVRPAA